MSPKQLTGALAQAPPVAAISTAGGGVARAAPATPRLESNVLHPRFAWKHVVVSNLSLLAEHQMLIFKSARLTEVVVADSPTVDRRSLRHRRRDCLEQPSAQTCSWRRSGNALVGSNGKSP